MLISANVGALNNDNYKVILVAQHNDVSNNDVSSEEFSRLVPVKNPSC